MRSNPDPAIGRLRKQRDSANRMLFVTSMPASRSNAIGLQTVYFAEALNCNWCHVYWDMGMDESEVADSYWLNSVFLREWPFAVGRGFLTKQFQRFGFGWWRGDRLLNSKKSRLRKMLKNTTFAYVAPLRNSEATKCREIIQEVGCPFVVHLWDISDSTLNSDYAWLFAHAERVFYLSPTMIEDICATMPCELTNLTFVRPPSKFKSRFGTAGELTIALIGFLSPYGDGLMLLSQAIDHLHSTFAKIRLIYVGPAGQLKHIPAPLSQITEYAGFLDDEGRDRVLADCHVAYLPGPLLPPELDLRSKHSIPSRMADYLAVGLPVIAAANAFSATLQFFSAIRSRGFFPVAEPQDIRTAIFELAKEKLWFDSSRECIAFFDAHFSCTNGLGELHSLVNRFM
jgi:glycosyltransferase involved in cell wall biosynthesis